MIFLGKKAMAKRAGLFFVIALTGALFFPGCATSSAAAAGNLAVKPEPITAELERDALFSLAAYVVVYRDWQTADEADPRGHNIGCILVDNDNNPVAWNLNSNYRTNDATQHGEVRVMQDYIRKSGNKYLEGYTIYTTLEPCVMCSGMMSLTKVGRTVYGQTDENYPQGAAGFGRAIERLKFDSTAIGGYPPYPRTPGRSDASPLSYRNTLDDAFSHGTETNITVFLTSETARRIYEEAAESFYTYSVQFPENQKVYRAVLALIDSGTITDIRSPKNAPPVKSK
jgi:tRNA(Arg) A34 adenosine deaminase TadA